MSHPGTKGGFVSLNDAQRDTLRSDMDSIRSACVTGMHRKEKYTSILLQLEARCAEIERTLGVVSMLFPPGNTPDHIAKLIPRFFSLMRGWKKFAQAYNTAHEHELAEAASSQKPASEGTYAPLCKPPTKPLIEAVEEMWWCNREAELQLTGFLAPEVSSVMVFLKRPGCVWAAGRLVMAYGVADKLVGTRNIKIFDRSTLELTHTIEPPDDVCSIALYKERTVIAGLQNGDICICDVVDGPTAPLKILKGHEGPVSALLVQDRKLFSGSMDRSISVWNLQSMTVEEKLPVSHWVSCLEYDSKRHCLYVGTTTGILQVFDMRTSSPVQMFQAHNGAIQCILVDNMTLWSGSDDQNIKKWTLKSDGQFADTSESEIWRGHSEPVVSLELLGIPQRRIVCSSCSGGMIIVWEENGEKLYTKKEWIDAMLKMLQG